MASDGYVTLRVRVKTRKRLGTLQRKRKVKGEPAPSLDAIVSAGLDALDIFTKMKADAEAPVVVVEENPAP